MELLQLDGLEVTLIRSKRRSLGLELSQKGVKARAPMRMSKAEIISFIESKRAWINKHLDAMPPPREHQPLHLNTGALVQLRGQNLTLRVEQGSRAPVRITARDLVVPVTHAKRPLEQRVKAKLIRWYKQVAQHELQTRARYYAQLMNVPARRADQIYVRDYKRRWGSCDSNGKLSFNWRILQAPTAVSDYVVVHELAHCHEFNHSKRFWAIVAKQMPMYKEQEAWLNRNGHQLYKF